MIRPITHSQILRLLLVAVVVIGITAAARPLLASASSQSFYVLDNKGEQGMLVSLTANSGVVAPATEKQASSLIGIISTSDISFNQQEGQVSVQTDGEATALVSTLGGDILIGDRIAPSSLAGIGQKMNQNGWMVGVAQASLDSKTKNTVATTITDTKGKKHTVYVARIPIIVHVTYYADASSLSSRASSAVPDRVQAAADALAGKHATLLGLVLSFFFLMIGVVVAGIIVNSTVRGAFQAIARQPLSKAAVIRMLIRSLTIAAAIIIITLIGALALIRVF